MPLMDWQLLFAIITTRGKLESEKSIQVERFCK